MMRWVAAAPRNIDAPPRVCIRCEAPVPPSESSIGGRVGDDVRWMHIGCFRVPHALESIAGIANVGDLPAEDQDRIGLLVAEASAY